MHFIYFSCLIVLARTSSIMLNGIGENGLLCINTDFKGDSFSLALLCMMLTEFFFFKYRPFIMLRKCPSFPSFPIMYVIKCVVFSCTDQDDFPPSFCQCGNYFFYGFFSCLCQSRSLRHPFSDVD